MRVFDILNLRKPINEPINCPNSPTSSPFFPYSVPRFSVPRLPPSPNPILHPPFTSVPKFNSPTVPDCPRPQIDSPFPICSHPFPKLDSHPFFPCGFVFFKNTFPRFFRFISASKMNIFLNFNLAKTSKPL